MTIRVGTFASLLCLMALCYPDLAEAQNEGAPGDVEGIEREREGDPATGIDQGIDAAEAALAKPHIILISADTFRADALSPEPNGPTPHLQALAAGGARFDTAYTHTATTGPAHGTLFTSRMPVVHGVTSNGRKLRESVPMLAEVLRDHGYQTAGFVSAVALGGWLGWNRGFDHFDENVSAKHAETRACRRSILERCGEETAEAVERWLDDAEPGERPLFLLVHFYDTHAPYAAPAPYAPMGPHLPGKAWRAEYDGEARYVDHLVGRILSALEEHGLRENAIIVFTSDHGDAIGEHGLHQHEVDIFEGQIRIPLIFSSPGRIGEGQVFSEPVGLIDVMPTLLDLVGARRSDLALAGRSLSKHIAGEAVLDPDHEILLQRTDYGEPKKSIRGHRVGGIQWGIRKGPWKYTVAPNEARSALYDLATDPGEERNLVEERTDVVGDLSERLGSWRRAREAEMAGQSPVSDVPAAMRDKLRELGYVQ